MEAFRHRRVGAPALIVLIFQNRGCRARITGEEQQQIVLQVKQRLLRNGHGRCHDRAVLREFKTGETSVRSDVLILLADGFLQNIDFDMTGLLCELMRVN